MESAPHRHAPARLLPAAALAVALAPCAALLPAGTAAAAKGVAAKPNIVFVMTDDQAPSSFTPKTMPKTHRFLVRRGTTFSDSIVTTPVCCPSRATFLTGQYAHNHRVLSNRRGYDKLRARRNILPVWLKRAGYRTAHVGKFLNGYERAAGRRKVAPGWDQWFTTIAPRRYYDYRIAMNGSLRRYGSRPRHHQTAVLGRRARRIAAAWSPGRRPFFLELHTYAPHRAPGDPGRCSRAAVPEPRDYHRFPDAPLPQDRLAPDERSYNEQDVSDKPSFIRSRSRFTPKEDKTIRRRWGCQLASLAGVDRAVARLVRVLRRKGELNRTAFFFTSDNGYFFGEHRIESSKYHVYEEGLRVPLVVNLPRYLRPKRPIPEVDLPVANIDVVPTFLDLAGAAPCARPFRCRTMDGRSILGLLNGDEAGFSEDRPIGIEFHLGHPTATPGKPCAYSGVRVSGETFVEYTSTLVDGFCDDSSVEYEHYDLAADPMQLENLHPAGRRTPEGARQRELAQLLDEVRDCAGIANRNPPPPSGHYCP